MHQNKAVLRFFGGARDLLFPPRCVGCDVLLPPFALPGAAEGVFCPTCRAAWDEARAAAAEATAEAAMRGHAYLTAYRTGVTDGVPERLVYHLKHSGDARVTRFVAERLAFGTAVAIRQTVFAVAENRESVEGEETAEGTDARPPIFTYPPRRRAAVRKDGFDQAKRLAAALSRASGGEMMSLIRRTDAPEDEQKTLHTEERRENAEAAYALRQGADKCVRGRTVVLCDDLSTTGATLSACERLLYAAGAVAVVWATVEQTV